MTIKMNRLLCREYGGIDCFSVVSSFLPMLDLMKTMLWIDAWNCKQFNTTFISEGLMSQVMERLLYSDCLLAKILETLNKVVLLESIMTDEQKAIINYKFILQDNYFDDLLMIKSWNDVHTVVNFCMEMSYVLFSEERDYDISLEIDWVAKNEIYQVYNRPYNNFPVLDQFQEKCNNMNGPNTFKCRASLSVHHNKCTFSNFRLSPLSIVKKNIVLRNTVEGIHSYTNIDAYPATDGLVYLIVKQEVRKGNTFSIPNFQDSQEFKLYHNINLAYTLFVSIYNRGVDLPITMKFSPTVSFMVNRKAAQWHSMRILIFGLLEVAFYYFTISSLEKAKQSFVDKYCGGEYYKFILLFSMDLVNTSFPVVWYFFRHWYVLLGGVTMHLLKWLIFRFSVIDHIQSTFRTSLVLGAVLLLPISIYTLLGSVFWLIRSSQWFYHNVSSKNIENCNIICKWLKLSFDWLLSSSRCDHVNSDTLEECSLS